MRLRNVKDISCLDSSPYIINEPYKFKGNYRCIFDNSKPIHIEIGMGKGKFIIEMALNNPDINFIGIEKFASVMVRAIQKIGDKEIPNLRLILMDAMEIDTVFDHEINMIYLNFSDPWPKAKHARRRLTSPLFLSKYDMIFKGDCNIIMKTDNEGLYSYSIDTLSEYGYFLTEISMKQFSLSEDNVTTEYEDKFIKLGKPIYKVIAIKCK